MLCLFLICARVLSLRTSRTKRESEGIDSYFSQGFDINQGFGIFTLVYIIKIFLFLLTRDFYLLSITKKKCV
jgi:hypothetical protein